MKKTKHPGWTPNCANCKTDISRRPSLPAKGEMKGYWCIDCQIQWLTGKGGN